NTVDISMETLASVWTHDPCDPRDLRDLGEKQHEPSSVWGESSSQQQDEELARLQEENNKLRAFLGSSFVTTLEQKAKKLKRNLTYMDEGPFPCGHQFVASQPVSKRVCRNLTAEFCSESSEASASSEPQLDIWVLRMLGLKDRDTIDTSNDSLQTPSEETFQFSSPAERIHFSPILSSTPVSNQPWTTGCSPTNLSAGSQPPVMPQTPRGRTDLAFSMSLCPSSSVKTHSFPQGQAFIRKDTEGRWNFTWVPRQGP
uniref:Geminin coiled-coil domain containing n=1 Tax=Seriola dumerili TaxID=41447 RepID=A0A3B4TU20_SERDU